MRLSGRRRRGLLFLTSLATVLVAASTGLSAAQPPQADPLQQQVDAIHDTGPVGVFAEVTSPDTRDRARAGTAETGTGKPMPRYSAAMCWLRRSSTR